MVMPTIAIMVPIMKMVMVVMIMDGDNKAIPDGNGTMDGDAKGCVVSSRKRKSVDTESRGGIVDLQH